MPPTAVTTTAVTTTAVTTTRRRRGPRGDLSTAQLLATADALLRTEGYDALTLRRLAQAAGASPNALYTYVDSMADLRHRLGDAFLGRLDLSLLQADPPVRALRAFLAHVLEVFAASPGHVRLLAAQRIAGPHALALNEALLCFFAERVGHDAAHAAGSTTLLTEWVHGRLLLSPTDAASSEFGDRLARLDLAPCPRTVAMLTRPSPDVTLDLLVRATTS